MTLSEEGEVRNGLRQARSLVAAQLNAVHSGIRPTSSDVYRMEAALAHIDQANDALDKMRANEEARRIAWARNMQEEAEELFL